MSHKVIRDLETTGSGCGAVRITYENLDVKVEYEYAKGLIGQIRFRLVRAFRYRDEMRSLGYAKGSYDTVVEIAPSPWLDELRSIEPPGLGDLEQQHHFAVMLSSNGYLEAIAAEVEFLPPVRGVLPEA